MKGLLIGTLIATLLSFGAFFFVESLSSQITDACTYSEITFEGGESKLSGPVVEPICAYGTPLIFVLAYMFGHILIARLVLPLKHLISIRFILGAILNPIVWIPVLIIFITLYFRIDNLTYHEEFSAISAGLVSLVALFVFKMEVVKYNLKVITKKKYEGVELRKYSEKLAMLELQYAAVVGLILLLLYSTSQGGMLAGVAELVIGGPVVIILFFAIRYYHKKKLREL